MYTKDEKTEKMQTVIYEILCTIDDFCNENSIKYFLSGGTCLGAIRHHGFIPWDDDGDVMMPREDYERFINEFETTSNSRFKITTLENNKDCNLPYARVWDPNTEVVHKTIKAPKIGISVDVFPIDGVSENALVRKLYFFMIKVLDRIAAESIRKEYTANHKYIILRKIVGKCAEPIGAHAFASLMNNMAKKRSFEESRYVACSLPAHYGERETIKKEQMQEPKFFDFEGRKFPVPCGYNEYLRNLYGDDYMTIPDGPSSGQHLDVWDVKFDVHG